MDADHLMGTASTGSTVHPYVEFAFASDPVGASIAGYRQHDAQLGEVDAAAINESCATRRRLLTQAEAAADAATDTANTGPAAEGTAPWFEQQLLLTELRSAVLGDERQRPWARAPYWYPERIGEALSTLMRPDGDSAADGRNLLERLRQIPAHLTAAMANLTDDAPPLWAQMGTEAAAGLSTFLGGAVRGYAATLPAALGQDVIGAAADAGPAVDEYADACRRLAGQATGSWVAGRDYVDAMLREFQHVELDADQLAELGRQKIEAARRDLVEFAARLDPDTPWDQQIARLKEHHPAPEDLLTAYADAMLASREHTRSADLLTVPAGESCRVDWVPEYERASLPLGVMKPVAPYANGLDSEFLITPTDPAAPQARRQQHLRDNSFVFIASIAGHETYPGHHLQCVHHKLGTATDSISRYLRSPQFVEGWGLYVEDLLDETGFMDDTVRLFKLRNALWRALRVVIDVGLHTRTLTFDDAVAMLERQAGMDQHMATGEVRRYTRHDNPTYPSSYLLGRDLLHRLRGRWQRSTGNTGLRAFHDRLLSFGSAPIALLEPMLMGD